MQQPVQRQGHDWNIAEDVREYVERVDRADRRAEGLALLTRLVQRAPDEPLRVLDVGTGQGLLAAQLLDAFPVATAVGLDASDPLLDQPDSIFRSEADFRGERTSSHWAKRT